MTVDRKNPICCIETGWDLPARSLSVVSSTLQIIFGSDDAWDAVSISLRDQVFVIDVHVHVNVNSEFLCSTEWGANL